MLLIAENARTTSEQHHKCCPYRLKFTTPAIFRRPHAGEIDDIAHGPKYTTTELLGLMTHQNHLVDLIIFDSALTIK